MKLAEKKHHIAPAAEIEVFSPFLRIFHWLMVASVMVLFWTGLYIGDPWFYGGQGSEPTFALTKIGSMETVRMVHFIAAQVLISAFILRIYGFIRFKGDRLLPKFWTPLFWSGMKEMHLHYMFLRWDHRPWLRNPLARSSYTVIYILMIIEAITGFGMYVKINPNSVPGTIFGPVYSFLGDGYVVHLVHHVIAWLIILFAVIHVNFAFRADMMEHNGEISSMFSGVKYFRKTPVDIDDIK